LDLADKGFLKTKDDTDILSVNNEIALSMRHQELIDALSRKKGELNLPNAI